MHSRQQKKLPTPVCSERLTASSPGQALQILFHVDLTDSTPETHQQELLCRVEESNTLQSLEVLQEATSEN